MRIDTNKIRLFFKKFIRGFLFFVLHLEVGNKNKILNNTLYKCNECGNEYFKNDMVYFDKQDGPYCKSCVRQWTKPSIEKNKK